MRIIAGKHKGRKLMPPIDQHITRPITDRVKQSLFDRLEMAGFLDETTVLDACAGTGSMGLESLSRGAKHVTFIERDHRIRKRLTRNVELIGQLEDSKILGLDALSYRAILQLQRYKYDLLFFDPPYRYFYEDPDRARALKQISRLAEVAAEDAQLIVRTSNKTELENIEPWFKTDERTYGSMALHYYQLTEPEAEDLDDTDGEEVSEASLE